MNRNIIRRMLQTFFTLFIQGLILFLSAWTLDWVWAWAYIITGIIILLVNLIVLPREVIEERGGKKQNVKKWDQILTSINIIPLLGIYLISGLDHRFGWSMNFSGGIHILGLVSVFGGSMLFTWSMVSNRFFSTMVRIQKERKHTTATEGPYKYIRHPGYVAFILMNLAAPAALGSLYGLIPAGIVAVIFIIRTGLEDQTLQRELSGYQGYSQEVKYKLIPYIW